jgi:hypothetical protein
MDQRPFAPPSVLPDISPTWGEIGGFHAVALVADSLRKRRGRLISPLVGEMSGRTEGGAKDASPFRKEYLS